MSNDKIKELEQKIAELKSRWPEHSVPTSMWLELDDLEEELNTEKKRESSATG